MAWYHHNTGTSQEEDENGVDEYEEVVMDVGSPRLISSTIYCISKDKRKGRNPMVVTSVIDHQIDI